MSFHVLAILCVIPASAAAQVAAPAPPAVPARTATSASDVSEPSQQEKGRSWGLALGVAMRLEAPVGEETTGSASGPAFVLRIMRRKSGLVPAIRLGLTPERTTLVDARSVSEVTTGSLSLRPFMAGVGWWQPIGHRTSVQIAGTVGYSWNKLDLEDHGSGSLRLAMPGQVVSVKNSPAWEVSGQVWYDVTSRISLMASAAFLQARPDIAFADGTTKVWRADQVRVQAGVAFAVMKPRPASGRR
jgi:hypothetical protein